ncbi:helix-turn-helix transcriptional regulator [Plantibacter sp. MCCC 1A11337]|uniref:helix-turn-helix domain-containing protein n=1 Tax=Plantibacter sp. MCCC 1A11337 TaxID=2736644 RepID=UPI00158420D9|nr:helix-turn-helix transcriptional regulator [Plantibacter sp. MCCC 1A11337]NUJ89170.1 helix-turn-helix transcriptional regulator [Plantibacter sp. MCCC 1A11337]
MVTMSNLIFWSVDIFCYGDYVDTGSDFNAAVAAALRQARTDRGLTFDELSSRAGMVRRTVLRYLNGGREIPVPALFSLARALDVAPHEILSQAEASHPAQPAELPSDNEPGPRLDAAEVGRRLTLLVDAQSRGRSSSRGYDEISPALKRKGVLLSPRHWVRLLDGEAETLPSPALTEIADVLGVDRIYLTEPSSDPRVDAIDAQLEFTRASHAAGFESLAARTVADVAPSTLRAIAAQLGRERSP